MINLTTYTDDELLDELKRRKFERVRKRVENQKKFDYVLKYRDVF
jgi:hypothetical protein